eukprot:6357565-Alexandrium_andersonii.AAC.1
MELLRWPTRYRGYFGCVCPDMAVAASGAPSARLARGKEWDLRSFGEDSARELRLALREALGMKRRGEEWGVGCRRRQLFRGSAPRAVDDGRASARPEL